MATIFKLIIEDDEGKTTVYPLSDGEIAIGRRDGNTIRLMERNVSRRHAKLNRTNGTVFIEDLDSYNGIRINGERITGKYEVKEGDLVEIGDYHLALQRTEVQEAAPAGKPVEHEGQWPQAGTVPDFRLPDEVRQDVQHYDRGPRDTHIDEPVPPALGSASAGPEPMVRPPPRGADDGLRDLPPFPTPGGAPLAKVPLSQSPGQSAGEEELTEVPPEKKQLAIGPARVSTVPRLVCVSTSYAGKEFALTRPELIIGRVEDNDIVIEHRSVSRNHAKILSNNGAHKIIDLQSANGILVNGEEYAMTDLRKGDLIELGHVRFRFIPANEAFVPKDEEANEMRTAGVEPPSKGPLPLDAPAIKGASESSSVGAYDPSQAATVTDTPLDALNMGQAFAPAIESRTVPTVKRNSSGPKAPTPAPKRAADDQRPTELNRVARQANALGSPAAVAPARADSIEPSTRQERLDDAPKAPASKLPLIVALVLLLVTAIVLSVVLMMPRANDVDERFEQLAKEQKLTEAIEYYEQNQGKFGAPDAAKTTYDILKAVLDKTPSVVPNEPDEPEPIPTPEEPPPVEEPPPTKRVKRPPPPPPPPEEPPPKRKVKRRSPPKGNAAAELEAGTKALTFGDLTKAEVHLLKCIEIEPKYARCHRTLGVLYAQKDDSAKAVQYYRRYVELSPNAGDAEKVRRMIDEATR